jgi:hypothetical protein
MNGDTLMDGKTSEAVRVSSVDVDANLVPFHTKLADPSLQRREIHDVVRNLGFLLYVVRATFLFLCFANPFWLLVEDVEIRCSCLSYRRCCRLCSGSIW